MEKKDNKLSKIADKKKSPKSVVVENKKKPNIFKRIGNYFKGVFKEIKRIKWTSGSDLLKYSISTILFILFIIGFYLFYYSLDIIYSTTLVLFMLYF